MTPRLPIARLLAAMILAIVAWAAPSAAGAHEGHLHRGHRGSVSAPVATSSVAVRTSDAVRFAPTRPSVQSAGRPAPDAVGALRPGDEDRDDGRGLGGLCCCGAACCAPGILASGVVLPGPASGNAVLRPYDAATRIGIGPEALIEPPRPFA